MPEGEPFPDDAPVAAYLSDEPELDENPFLPGASDRISPAKTFVGMVLNQGINEGANNVYFMPLRGEYKMFFSIGGINYEMLPPPRCLSDTIGEELERIFGKVEEHVSKKRVLRRQEEPIITKRMSPGDIARKYFNFTRGSATLTLTKMDASYGAQCRVKIFYNEHGQEEFQDGSSEVQDLLKTSENGGLILIASTPDNGRTSTAHKLIRLLSGREKRIITIGGEPYPTAIHAESVETRQLEQFNPDMVYFDNIKPVIEQGILYALNGKIIIGSVIAPCAAAARDYLIGHGTDKDKLEKCLKGTIGVRLERQKDDCSDGCEACRGTGYLGRKAIYEIRPSAR